MNTLRTISRVLVVSAVVLVSNAKAVCPLFQNEGFKLVNQNKNTIGTTIMSEHFCAKNEHLKRAFLVTAGAAADKKLTAEQFGERLVVDYSIRRGSELVNINKLRDSAVKTADVLPDGMIRDLVNPAVEGAAAVATHPEFLTYLAMEYLIPTVVGMLKGKTN